MSVATGETNEHRITVLVGLEGPYAFFASQTWSQSPTPSLSQWRVCFSAFQLNVQIAKEYPIKMFIGTPAKNVSNYNRLFHIIVEYTLNENILH